AYATRAIAEYTTNAQDLVRNRNEAGVSMAPDEEVRKIAGDAMMRLNSLQGAECDTAYADAQLRVQTAAVAQYGAFSQDGKDGSLRRHAERSPAQVQAPLGDAQKLAGSR